MGSPKMVAFEGEFAMCAGHAQELKTQAIALQIGKRLRMFFSDNNAGIDDCVDRRRRAQQVRRLPVGGSVDVVRMERVLDTRRPRLRPDSRRPENDGGLGPGGSPADDRVRQDHERVLARRPWTERFPASGDQIVGYPEPPVRVQDELGLHRLAGADLRGALRRPVRRHPRRRR